MSRLRSRPAAVLAGLGSLVGELFFGAESGFLEGDDDLALQVPAFGGADAESAAADQTSLCFESRVSETRRAVLERQ